MTDDTLRTDSIVSSKDNAPIVQFQLRGMKFQLMPNKARDLAARILQAADAAESDAFLCLFLTEKLGTEMPVTVQILQQFREFRELRRRLDYLPRESEPA